MSYYQNFAVSQTSSNPAYVIFTDTSSGTDASIDSRRIFVQDCNGAYIVPTGTSTNYIEWSLLENPISIDLLTQDQAVSITVQWLSSTGAVLYTIVGRNYCLSEFNRQFLYYLIQLQSLNYNIIQDSFYWTNVGIFWTNIIGATNAVEIGDDIFGAQTCLNRATNMAQNQAKYF